MQTPSSPQSLWKGIYKKREKQSQKFGIELKKQIVHIIVLFHLYKVQNLVKQPYLGIYTCLATSERKTLTNAKFRMVVFPGGAG